MKSSISYACLLSLVLTGLLVTACKRDCVPLDIQMRIEEALPLQMGDQTVATDTFFPTEWVNNHDKVRFSAAPGWEEYRWTLLDIVSGDTLHRDKRHSFVLEDLAAPFGEVRGIVVKLYAQRPVNDDECFPGGKEEVEAEQVLQMAGSAGLTQLPTRNEFEIETRFPWDCGGDTTSHWYS